MLIVVMILTAYIVVYIGDRLPYLASESFFKIRYFVVLPVLACCFFSLLLIAIKVTESASWRKGKVRLSAILSGLICSVFIALLVSYSIIPFAGVLSALAPGEIESEIYVVTNVEERGGALWSGYYEYNVQNVNKESYKLPLSKARYNEVYSKGDEVTIKVKKTIFGRFVVD